METNTTTRLIKNLERKGIKFDYGERQLFKKYDYYQVINAYKNLFIVDVENIDKIKENIENNIDVDRYKYYFGISSNIAGIDLFKEICKKIIKKYGLEYNKNMSLNTLIKEIRRIGYIHHIYATNTKYSDFVRMYKFEHELRLLLLRYTLIIEENMKNIFISTLNDSEDVNANFLSDINNYNTADANNNNSLETLKLIIDKQGNKHSKPIQRKRQQNITVPYWILINELAMNQTYRAINNLKPEIERKVFQKCVNHFTKLNINVFDKNKKIKMINNEHKLINSFKTILYYIGEFRNMLAHNQPIYSYNVKDCSLFDFPNINYEYPSNSKRQLTNDEQYSINAKMMYNLQKYFGIDQFNSRNLKVNIDLSWMIYVIYKIIFTIDSNTNFYEELRKTFIKYNIVLTEYEYKMENCKKYNDLLKQLEELYSFDLNINEISSRIEQGESYKKLLKNNETRLNTIKKEIKKTSKEMKVKKIKSKYILFPSNQDYKRYTNIDASFFNQIK
ncbi:MAG: Abi family protein [Bacilli bacterium]|nr:Abi family protein [Bacilli bacterium]